MHRAVAVPVHALSCHRLLLPPLLPLLPPAQAHCCCHQGGWAAGQGAPAGLFAVFLPRQAGVERAVLWRGGWHAAALLAQPVTGFSTALLGQTRAIIILYHCACL